jgi:hypothetical protein
MPDVDRFATLRRVSGGRHRAPSAGIDASQALRSLKTIRWSLQRVAIALAILSAIAVAPFGGWSAAAHGPAGPPPRLEVDQVSEGGPWKITITGGRLLDDQPPLRATDPNNRWVIILATVEVTADTSRKDIADALRISGAEGLVDDDEPGTVALVSDFTQYPTLHPGLPESVLFAWEQSATAPVPTEVEVTIFGKTLRPDSLSGLRQWLDLAPRAVVRVPIVDRRGL